MLRQHTCIIVTISLLFIYASCEHSDECENLEFGTFVASSKNCHQYIYCNGVDSVIGNCPAEHHFNADEHTCDVIDGFVCPISEEMPTQQQHFSSTTNELEITATIDTSSSNEATTTISSIHSTTVVNQISEELTELLKPSNAVGRPKCLPDVEETFAHPLKCEYYYKCVYGFLTILRCNFYYGWDFQLKQCVPIHEAKCLNGES